jgi:hypothetical protein
MADSAQPALPGTIKPRRFRPRFQYELLSAGIAGAPACAATAGFPSRRPRMVLDVAIHRATPGALPHTTPQPTAGARA